MDLWQLHIFCKVVEHTSFSKAAKIVQISQPTISSHIKDLENHFGCFNYFYCGDIGGPAIRKVKGFEY